jgi:DnaK suppressor protein
MIAVNFETYYDRLKNRRNEIMMTLEHVHREQRAVEDNEEWIDRAAYEGRVHLLDNLANWYLDEITRIDDALIRITEGKYGVCVGCHEPIGLRHLETAPEAAFCTECEKMRDDLSVA